ELFAGHAGDEASATNLAPRLEPAIDPRQVAPWRDVRFTRQQAPEDDAVALEERPRLQLDGRLDVRCRLRVSQQGPPPGNARSPSCGAGTTRRRADDRSQSTEAIRRDETCGHQIAQRRAYGLLVASRGAGQFVLE